MPSRSTSRNVAVFSPAATARSPATIGTALAGPTIWSSSCAVTICALIFERVWGYDFGPSSNSLEVYVGYLRRKLEAEREARVIQTVRGVGYALREP